MKLLGCLTLLAGIAIAQNGADSSHKPGPFEIAASRSDAHVVRSEPAGRLESGPATAIFTVMAVQDPSHSDRQIRGVRVDFAWPDGKASIYVEEADVFILKTKTEQFAQGAEAFSARSNVTYSTACPEDSDLNLPLFFEYRFANNGAGLHVFGPKLQSVAFPGETPENVAAVFARAENELKTR